MNYIWFMSVTDSGVLKIKSDEFVKLGLICCLVPISSADEFTLIGLGSMYITGYEIYIL